jgi:hypothetical protein
MTATRYWDWVADSAAPAKAKVFDTMHGFGTNGTNTRDHCLVDGPFKDLRPAYWNGEPRNEFNPPCLARAWEPGYPEFGVIEMYGEAYSPPVLERINAIEDFDEFRRDLESGPHAAIHGGVGGRDGDMGLQSSSPNGMFRSWGEDGMSLTEMQTRCSSSTTPRSTGCGGAGSSRMRPAAPLCTTARSRTAWARRQR